MYRILAGNLTATFNLDGKHLSRHLERGDELLNVLCDDLILHDRILIPTQDYLTACGLIILLGEDNLISLLESDQINFLRLRGAFGYIRGEGPDGTLICFSDPERKKAQSSSIDSSIEAGLTTIRPRMKEHDKLKNLLIEKSAELEMSDLIDTIKHDSFEDLRQTRLWKDEYDFENPDLLALPGMKKMQVTVLGPATDPTKQIVDLLLSIALSNIELYLSEKYECSSTSTASPLGGLIDLKLRRLCREAHVSSKLWTLLEINNVPDFRSAIVADSTRFDDFCKLTRSRDAEQFREWFHKRKDLSEKEVLKEYVGVLGAIPWIQQTPARVIRFVLTTGLGLIPGVGQAVSFLDSFVVDRILKGDSPKFFVEGLKQFKGRIDSAL